jgi:hypothetical protein
MAIHCLFSAFMIFSCTICTHLEWFELSHAQLNIIIQPCIHVVDHDVIFVYKHIFLDNVIWSNKPPSLLFMEKNARAAEILEVVFVVAFVVVLHVTQCAELLCRTDTPCSMLIYCCEKCYVL